MGKGRGVWGREGKQRKRGTGAGERTVYGMHCMIKKSAVERGRVTTKGLRMYSHLQLFVVLFLPTELPIVFHSRCVFFKISRVSNSYNRDNINAE